MPIAESEVRWVEEPKLGFWEQLYIPAIIDGLKTTIWHLFSKKITEQYPEAGTEAAAATTAAFTGSTATRTAG